MKRVEIYRDRTGGWRWRSVARNGKRTANPGEAYATKWNACRAAKRACPDVPIVQTSRT